MWVRIPPAAPGSWGDYECRATPPDTVACADPDELDATYVYLLGLYLGDGCISRAPRNVWRLRIFQDRRYTNLIEECQQAISAIARRPPGTVSRTGWVEIYSNWKHWPCLLPQHGPGLKHRRSLEFKDWQRALVAKYPRALLRGLIHSDGCRAMNRVRRPTRDGVKRYEYVRYFFTNASGDIRALFAEACRLVGIDCRRTTERVLSVARRDSVRLLDEFVGPKS